jgi:lipopolysaccharide/colanic/teichoic acid biosynthesis glycosyltransferase
LSKRLLDVIVGTALAVFVTPVIVGLAIGSAIALRAWPLFTQVRVGKNGRRFRLFKVRTLPPEVEPYADKYDLVGIRIPRYCQLLRRLHLDELPQLWLVPTGRMSLVGPRPEMPALHARFDPCFADLRTSVRPGCSGLWQVGDGSAQLIAESPEYDEVYVANAGLRLDLWVLWRTIGTMIGRALPCTIDDVPAWALRRRPARITPPAPAPLATVTADQG